MVAKEKEKEASKLKKKKEKRSYKANEKEDADALAGKQNEVPYSQARRCQQCTALQQCSKCSRRKSVGLQIETPHRARPIAASPAKIPHGPSHPHSDLLRAEGSGEWEVQHGKRRGAFQVCPVTEDHSGSILCCCCKSIVTLADTCMLGLYITGAHSDFMGHMLSHIPTCC